MADIFEKLALLSDAQIHGVLNRMIEGYAARNPNVPVGDPEALALILTKAGQQVDEKVQPQIDAKIPDASVAEREILVRLSHDPAQVQFVEGALSNDRKVLFEPITTALVMAGIIFLLQTEFDVKISKKGGKTDYDVHVGKKPTDKSILQKFFSLFS